MEGQVVAGSLQVPAGTTVPAPGHYAGVLSVAGDRPRRVPVVVDAHRRVRLTGPLPATGARAALDFLP